VLFFRFIFNIADASITIGVIILLLFYRKTLIILSFIEKRKRKACAKETRQRKRDKQ